MIRNLPRLLSVSLSQFLSRAFVSAALWTLALAGSASGEAVFSLESIGTGKYVISGVGLEKIAALDFIVAYDTSTAGNPKVAKINYLPTGVQFQTIDTLRDTVRLAGGL